MQSPLRLFFIIPIVFFALIALIQLALNGLFNFALWGFVDVVVALICVPIIINANDRYVPIYHIFTIFITLLITFVVIIFTDLQKYFALNGALTLSVFGSIVIVGLLMFFRGNDS